MQERNPPITPKNEKKRKKRKMKRKRQKCDDIKEMEKKANYHIKKPSIYPSRHIATLTLTVHIYINTSTRGRRKERKKEEKTGFVQSVSITSLRAVIGRFFGNG